MKKVLGMGNALVDILVQIPDQILLARFDLPKGSMTHVDEDTIERILSAVADLPHQQTTGGSAANTINGLARLGVPTHFIGKVGHDPFGTYFKKELSNHEISSTLFKGKARTGRVLALITTDSERTFATHLGSAIEMTDSELMIKMFRDYDYFHVEGYLVQNHALLEKAVKLAKKAGLEVSLDLASFNVVKENIDFLKKIITDHIDIVFANQEEAEAFTGKERAHDCLGEMAKRCKIAIVKQGKSGSLIKHQDNHYQVESIKVNAIDSTGAGDLYAAGFLYGHIMGYSPAICGRIGSILSGKVVEVIGAKLDEAKWQEARYLIDQTVADGNGTELH